MFSSSVKTKTATDTTAKEPAKPAFAEKATANPPPAKSE